MGGLRRSVGEQAVGDRVRRQGVDDSGCGRCHETVDDDRHALCAGGQDGTGHGGNVAATDAPQDFKAVALLAEPADRQPDRIGLSSQAVIVDAGAAAYPVARGAAVKSMIDRRGDRGVGDTHLAKAQKVDAAGDRFHAVGDGRRAGRLVKGVGHGDIGCRQVERQLEYLQPEVAGQTELVDRRASGGEILHHLTRDGLRKGRDAAIGDAVVGGKDGDERPVHRRLRICLPGGEPLHQFLHPAKAAGRLSQLRITPADGINGIGIGTGQRGDKPADIVEGQTGRGGCHDDAS